jgi:hypothetical protein
VGSGEGVWWLLVGVGGVLVGPGLFWLVLVVGDEGSGGFRWIMVGCGGFW